MNKASFKHNGTAEHRGEFVSNYKAGDSVTILEFLGNNRCRIVVNEGETKGFVMNVSRDELDIPTSTISSVKINFVTNKERQDRNIPLSHLVEDIARDAYGININLPITSGISERVLYLYDLAKSSGESKVLDLDGQFIWIITPNGKIIKAFKHIEYIINE
ncbi:hypothetical protein SP15_223 [Bacillus phage SP-15]|uniref:Uncharacterized protein n=1 Tax=Bacillus phage SP-15 TaxID=1792032 RepID=A0A127AXU0_9CAUD|nr:hypothetical protein SP15_223 [Bacillus phage SP-15]AMM45024.1 hypothetical protein SP15_223 [Bacillus phage SP-15]